ncbi:lasso peptide biosynthesis PqqD family chaperone [Bacillus sp. USDA818B3_A]|uniref:lasso peptide biosynthesis PqqD family chaperone n=1 Tax=Bacillus sp. USDA818B3_A TaxID=2698834 RepID=UPI001367A634|nr:lasso peptide biosynthesis PqqD family chaperone [Bacillus sp. USDA818B3_A]
MIKNQVLSNKDIIVKKGENYISNMDGEKVMLSIQNGKYYNLGGIGGEIWDRIRDSITIPELITTLIAEYDIDRNQCEEEVMAFLQNLIKEDLIEILE